MSDTVTALKPGPKARQYFHMTHWLYVWAMKHERITCENDRNTTAIKFVLSHFSNARDPPQEHFLPAFQTSADQTSAEVKFLAMFFFLHVSNNIS